jgi:hypothetical protein
MLGREQRNELHAACGMNQIDAASSTLIASCVIRDESDSLAANEMR